MAEVREFTGTKGMSRPELEVFAQAALASDRTKNLMPSIIMLWMDALFLGFMLFLFVEWKAVAERSERKGNKAVVYFLILLHIGMSAYLCAWQLGNYAQHFGEYFRFMEVNWNRIYYVMIAFSCVPCFAFFAHRTWLMYGRHWIIPVILIPMICTSGSSFLVIAALCDSLPMNSTVKGLIFALGSCELTGHLIITTLLGRKLLQSKTGFKATDSLLTKILITLVETQAPPTIAALLWVIVVSKLGDTPHVTYLLALPKVYPICLFASLNSRIHLNVNMSNNHSYTGASFTLPSSDTLSKGFEHSRGTVSYAGQATPGGVDGEKA